MKSSNNTSLSNLLAVILAIFVLLVAWKLTPSYAAAKVRVAELQDEIAAAQGKKDALDEAASQLSGLQSDYDKIIVSVSSDADEANIISELEAIALKNNIVLPSISISAQNEATSAVMADIQQGGTLPVGLNAISIAINVTGSFDQLNNFITAVEKSVKFMNIKSLNYSNSEEGSLALSLQIEAYQKADTMSASQ